MSVTKTGWIGLGKMGIPMSQQLIKAGYPVTVYNRNKDKEESLKALGASVAATPAELLEQNQVVIIMVSDDQAIQEIFNAENGLFQASVTGRYIINMSTVSPAISQEMAAQCKDKGHHYLDAPVSGSVKQAEDGQLVIMAGGEAAAFEEVKPLLDSMSKLALLVGDNGAGNTAKLAINTLLAIHAQGLAEAIALAEKNNISAEVLMELINNGALSNPFARIKGDAIVNDNYKPAFALKQIVKDLRLAKDIGLNTPLGETAYQTYQAAESDLGEEDMIAIFKKIKA